MSIPTLQVQTGCVNLKCKLNFSHRCLMQGGDHKNAEQVIATKGSTSTVFPCCISYGAQSVKHSQASLLTHDAPHAES